jgi:SnoaL-like domain
MPLVESQRARKFAEEWLAAWNSHDLVRVLSLFSDDFEFASPLIVKIAGAPSSVLKGKPAIRDYWSKGLDGIPDLRFELIDVLTGIDRVTLYYKGHSGMVAESFVFGANGLVISAAACYA